MASVSDAYDWRHLRGKIDSGEELARLYGILHPPVDVHGIVRRLGIELLPLTTTGLSGQAEVRLDSGTAKIWVSTVIDSRRLQRFSVAHELAHVLMHPEGIHFRDNRSFTAIYSGSSWVYERQANEFAAALLMPEWVLSTYVSGYGLDTSLLADVFDVSLSAMTVRMSRLGYL